VENLVRKLSNYTFLLGAVGLVDLVTTLYMLEHGDSGEANPLMAPLLAHGVAVLIATKLGLTLVPLSYLEWARHRRPAFVLGAQRAAVAGYLFLYCLGIARVNRVPTYDQITASMNCDPLAAQVRAESLADIAARRTGLPATKHISWSVRRENTLGVQRSVKELSVLDNVDDRMGRCAPS
jgi:hypothetical protein